MKRRGFTLLEMMLSISMAGVVLDIGMNVTGSLLRLSHDGGQPAQRVDLACDALRRDLSGGGRVIGTDLLAGKIRWHVAGGRLLRDGVERLRVQNVVWHESGPEVVVHIRPLGFADREVCAWR